MARQGVKPAKRSENDKAVDASFHEVYSDVPESVEKSGKTGEAKRKMMIAVALSKARRAAGRK